MGFLYFIVFSSLIKTKNKTKPKITHLTKMAKLYSAIVILATIAAVAAAALIYAAGDIAFIECQDHECRRGCRTIGKIPEDQCHTPPFQHNKATRAVCSQAPAGGSLCYYFGMFHKNDTTGGTNYCTDTNAEFLFYHQCGVCRPSHHHKGTYEITTCESSNQMKMSYGCSDSTCGNCTHTHSLKEKTCTVPPNFPSAIEVTAPSRCAQAINYYHYDAPTCNVTAAVSEKIFSGVCYGFGSRSHLYQCA